MLIQQDDQVEEGEPSRLSLDHPPVPEEELDQVVTNGYDDTVASKDKSKLEVLDDSGSQRAIENLLKVYYEPLELFFLRTSIEKVCSAPASLRPRTFYGVCACSCTVQSRITLPQLLVHSALF